MLLLYIVHAFVSILQEVKCHCNVQAYTISERAGAVRIYLRVNKAAAFDYSVIIGTTDTSASKCIYV